jgi:hypothetical protein
MVMMIRHRFFGKMQKNLLLNIMVFYFCPALFCRDLTIEAAADGAAMGLTLTNYSRKVIKISVIAAKRIF